MRMMNCSFESDDNTVKPQTPIKHKKSFLHKMARIKESSSGPEASQPQTQPASPKSQVKKFRAKMKRFASPSEAEVPPAGDGDKSKTKFRSKMASVLLHPLTRRASVSSLSTSSSSSSSEQRNVYSLQKEEMEGVAKEAGTWRARMRRRRSVQNVEEVEKWDEEEKASILAELNVKEVREKVLFEMRKVKDGEN